jgi:molybdopterin synthase catalytic subunit
MMALRILDRICDEIEERFGVRRMAIVHRTGTVPIRDASIAIVVCSPHRDAAFGAARYAIEETKARAPIWKAEQFEDGHVWIGSPARTVAADPARVPEEDRRE